MCWKRLLKLFQNDGANPTSNIKMKKYLEVLDQVKIEKNYKSNNENFISLIMKRVIPISLLMALMMLVGQLLNILYA